MELSDDIRYARHLALAEIGPEGQQRLAASTALVVGLGGLGAPAAMYLAASGVGRLLLNDFDRVDPTNLQRQVLYREVDVGRDKADAARERLAGLNGSIALEALHGRLDGSAMRDAAARADVVLDCSDNFGTRFALNAACLAARKPLIAGAAVRLGGQVMVFDFRDGQGPCYACLFDEAGETLEDCAGNGVLAPLVGVIGALQAVEALKLLAGFGEPATGRLLRFDAATLGFRVSVFDADPACSICA